MALTAECRKNTTTRTKSGGVTAQISRIARQHSFATNWLDTIHTGDCAEVMRQMPSDFVDLTVTSPPYDNLRDYKGYGFDFENIAAQLLRVTKPGGIVVWVVGDRVNGGRSLTSFRQAIHFQDAGFRVHDAMIYRKKNTPFMRRNAYTNCYEFMFVLSKGRPNTFNPLTEETARNGYEMLVYNKGPDGVNKKVMKELKKEKTLTNVWSYAVGLGGTTSDRYAFDHPAMFPEKLAKDHILSWSNPGDIVLDPMCGAGTTLKMAAAHERRYIGIDIAEEYTAIAKRRVAEQEKE